METEENICVMVEKAAEAEFMGWSCLEPVRVPERMASRRHTHRVLVMLLTSVFEIVSRLPMYL